MSTSETKKNPITLKIKFKSASIEQFIERYSVDVSRGGIFIRTKEPLAVGTPLRFEFQLQDGTALISGDGTVVWNRAADPNRSTVVPGMGVRFDKLTTDSQRVLERILSDKEKLGNTGLESRFDAGVRASLGASADPAPSQETPKGNIFGEEPTRAMSADQVNKLAEASQRGATEEDLPTKLGPASDLADDVRKLAGGSMDGSGSLPAIPTTGLPAGLPGSGKLEPMRAPASGNPMIRSTLLGQGFGLAPTAAPSNPGLGGPDPLRRDPSGLMAANKIEAAASAPLDSAVTPVKSAEAAHVAESQRTPSGSESGPVKTSEPTPAQTPSSTSGPKQTDPAETPAQTPVQTPSVPTPREPVESARPATPQPESSGGSKGLLIGAAILLLLVAAAGYFVFVFQKGQPPPETRTPPTEPVQQPLPPPPLPPPVLTPEKGATEAGKATQEKPGPEGKEPGKPGETTPGAADAIEVTSEPAGAQVDLAGKSVGVTPTKLPALTAGKLYDLKVSLRGYQEVRQKLKGGEEIKPLQFKLQAIERQLEVLSTPKGADVFIDGKKVGRTPWIVRKVDLAKAITVEIRRPGFETWSHNVSDAEAFVLRNKKEVLTLNATLEPAASKGRRQKKPEDGATATPEPAKPEPAKPEPVKPEEPKAAEPAKAEPAKQEEPKAPTP
jgi:uncharacterized protein (TIGR02266 family)